MLDKEILSFRVNGVPRQAAVRANQTLLEVLREDLGLTGTKEGCDDASCGACTVLLDGKPVISCVHVALLAEGVEVTTIEGVARDGQLSAVQEALIESGGLQCGYCTPGMVLAAHSLLAAASHAASSQEETAHDEAACAADGPPDRDTIREGLSNNLCRCTGYERIARAVELAASRLSPGAPRPTSSSDSRVTSSAIARRPEDPQGPPDA